MAKRTYTDVPEPRYVERARNVDNNEIEGVDVKSTGIAAHRVLAADGEGGSQWNIALTLPEPPQETKSIAVNDQGEIVYVDAPVFSVNGRTGDVTGLAEQEKVDKIKGDIQAFNSYDIVADQGFFNDKTERGVTMTWLGTTLKVNGTSTGDGTFCNFLGSSFSIPEGMVPGEMYHLEIQSTNANLNVQAYKGSSTIWVDTSTSKDFTIPADAEGFRFRIRVPGGIVYDNDTITVIIKNAKSNKELETQTDKNRTAIDLLEKNLSYLSCNHFYELPVEGNSTIEQYSEVEENISVTATIYNSTDYIKAPKYISFDFEDYDARIVINFYEKSGNDYIPRWDILKLKTSDDKLNYISIIGSAIRTISVPDNIYIKIAKPKNGNVHLFGWDGEHFGPELNATVDVPVGNDSFIMFGKKYIGLTLPGSAKAIVCKPDVCIRYIRAHKAGSSPSYIEGTDSNPVYKQIKILPEGYDYFRVVLADGYSIGYNESTHGSYEYLSYGGNINDKVSVLCEYTGIEPVGRAHFVKKNAEYITKIKWECLKKTLVADTTSTYFENDCYYKGIPYSSSWTDTHYLGWHISLHTFLNATNDVNSKFYSETDRKGKSFGYGHVCSTFATLCDGWKHPIVTYGLMRDPEVTRMLTNEPLPGTVLTNGDGHCMLGDTQGRGNGWNEYTIYEGVQPTTLRRSGYTFRDDTGHKFNAYSYVDGYKYACYNENADNYAVMQGYDITNGSITNGSARPYVGDRGVVTNLTECKVNIKDTSAQTLYVQKCTYNATTRTFTSTADDPVEIAIDGATQITVPSSSLTDGAFYAFYTDTDDTREYVEYHYVGNEDDDKLYYYSVDDTTITPPDEEFYYMVWWQDDVPSGKTELIPYLSSSNTHTYEEYRKIYNPAGAKGYIFFKGTLGAYVAPLFYNIQSEE